MKIRELRGRRLVLVLGIVFLATLLVARIVASTYIEILWFDSLGYTSVFWTRVFWEWGVRLLGALVVGLVFFFNLRFIARALGGIRIKRRVGDLVISEQLSETVVGWSVGVLSALVGAWFGASIPPSMGLGILYLLNAPEWGVTDPFLGRDLTFFVILLPLLRQLVVFGLVLAFLVFTAAAGGYAATGALQWGPARFVIENRPRVHLGVIIAAFCGLLGAQFWLARYVLFLNGTSGVQAIFGFADAEARIPAYSILALLALVVAAAALWSGFKNRPLPFIVASGVLLVGGLAVGNGGIESMAVALLASGIRSGHHSAFQTAINPHDALVVPPGNGGAYRLWQTAVTTGAIGFGRRPFQREFCGEGRRAWAEH